MFRIHPRTRDFEVFCEGTSNPWGIAFDGEGSAFVSACVIDHLWHLLQTGYYHRQGGPYPPFTWKIESIVQHKHQKAAYCGLCWFDSLGAESDDKLLQRLGDANIFYRDIAQRLLTERLLQPGGKDRQATTDKLADLVIQGKSLRKARLHALWTLIGAGPLPNRLHVRLVDDGDPTFRAWAVRAAGNSRKAEEGVLNRLLGLTLDNSPDVLLQWAIAATKVEGVEPMTVLLSVLRHAENDKLIPHIVWQNLHPILETHSNKFLDTVARGDLDPNLANLLPRAVDRILATTKNDPATFADLVKTLLDKKQSDAAQKLITVLANRARTGEIAEAKIPALRSALQPVLAGVLQKAEDKTIHRAAAILAVSLKDAAGYEPVRKLFLSGDVPESDRIKALDALIAGGDGAVEDLVAGMLTSAAKFQPGLRAQVISVLGRTDAGWVPKLTLSAFDKQEPEVQARIIDVLTQRPAWSKELLHQIGAKKIPAAVLNTNQVRKLQASKDRELASLVLKYWGLVRDERNPQREKVVAQMRKLLVEKRGAPFAGKAVFAKNCAICHKIHGEGQDVGPDISSNGRNDFEQLLSNVFDPNLVIGSGYQATSVTTMTGQMLQGLLVEDNPQRVVLKLQGGELKIIARPEIDEVNQSKVSLMPEQLENQMTPQEIRDLFAFLTLDRPPGDPQAKLIPGTPR